MMHQPQPQHQFQPRSQVNGVPAASGMVNGGTPVGDGTWTLSVFVTDLQVERRLRVKGDLHIGGVMLRLVDELGRTIRENGFNNIDIWTGIFLKRAPNSYRACMLNTKFAGFTGLQAGSSYLPFYLAFKSEMAANSIDIYLPTPTTIKLAEKSS